MRMGMYERLICWWNILPQNQQYMQFEGSKDEKARQKRKGIIIDWASYKYILYTIYHLPYRYDMTGQQGTCQRMEGRQAPGTAGPSDQKKRPKQGKERMHEDSEEKWLVIIMMIISHFADRALPLDSKSLSRHPEKMLTLLLAFAMPIRSSIAVISVVGTS